MPHLEAITIHTRKPAELAQFWSAALGLAIDPADLDAIADGTLRAHQSVLLGRRDGLHVWVSPAGELPSLGGRIHLDVRLDDPMPHRTGASATIPVTGGRAGWQHADHWRGTQ
ncbi:VOC family protein [Intrasporangium sp.]|uniref:VOC family protein n=1 Tax=Intrasporangium sp. TaxID=1925024 RepID=UPI003F81ED2B